MKKLLLFLLFFLALTASVRATDVTVGATTIPGFNPPVLPADVTLTGVTVNFGNPNASCANCFRTSWVGLGGFRISINGVAYTVKFVSNRSNLTLTTNYAGGDTTNATVIWYK